MSDFREFRAKLVRMDAADDLLDACRQLLAVLDCETRPSTEEIWRAIDVARAAIALATKEPSP